MESEWDLEQYIENELRAREDADISNPTDPNKEDKMELSENIDSLLQENISEQFGEDTSSKGRYGGEF